MEKNVEDLEVFYEMMTQLSNKTLVIDVVLNVLIELLSEKGIINKEDVGGRVDSILKSIVKDFEQTLNQEKFN